MSVQLDNFKFLNLIVFITYIVFFLSFTCNTSQAANRLPAKIKKQLLLKQFDQAIPLLKTLAEKGDNAARYQLAICYLNGDGINISVNNAVKLLRSASQKGHSKASYLLGSMYYNGDQIPKDISAAKSYLFIASQKGHRLAKKLLRQMDNVDSGTKLSRTEAQQRLEYAARTGDKNRAIDALKFGAGLNQKNSQGSTPLIIASRNKRYDFIQWFLSKKPKLSLTDTNKDTALHILALSAKQPLVKKLLKLGAKLDAENNNGRTPLINSVISEKEGLVKLFISQGANPYHQDKQQKNAFDYANNKNNETLIKILSPYKKINNNAKELNQRLSQLTKQLSDKDNLYYNWPIISVVVAQNELELVKLLMQQNTDPWQETPAGDNAISLAVKDKHQQLALELLTHTELDTSKKKQQALSLLNLAAEHDFFKLIKQLSTMLPASSPTQQKFMQTPLCHAIESSSESAALQLIQWQQSDFRADKRGRNLLHLAASEGLAQVVLALLKKGFDINATDQSQRSALWYATESGHSKVIKTLLSQQANVHQLDNNGHSALLRAVITGNEENIEIFMKYGADVNIKTDNGNTALIFAANSKPNIMKLLLNNSANVSVRNHKSLTPLMIAVTKKCLQCVQLLIKADANPNRKNSQGLNSFDLANDSEQILQLLDN